MPTWVYNSAGLGGIEKLEVANSGMANKLASSGNALQVSVESPSVKRVTYSPPGQGFSGSYTTGLERRIVAWRWAICAGNEFNLYDVEAVIARYQESGKTFTLSDGIRTSDHAVLHSARPASRYDKVTGGRWRRVWVLEFHVLAPRLGGAFL